MEKSLEEMSREVREIWDQNAGWWDERIGSEGNDFHRQVIAPATERLLGLRTGETVLDVACGNGQFARRMASLGARVVAFDFSERFIERARQHSIETGDGIEYLLLDATDEAALISLGDGRFDASVCTMALMDMAAIEPLMRALKRLLKPEGRFVFSVLHPCFNHGGMSRLTEEEDREGELVESYALKIVRYGSERPIKGIGIEGQPAPHYYFERTFETLLGACFNAGLVMDGIEEPCLDPERSVRRSSWAIFKEIPPVLVVRMRPGK